MRRYILLVFYAFAIVINCYPDEICDSALSEGKQLYSKGQYQKAKELFAFVKDECGSTYANAASWIAKCDNAMKPKLVPAPTPTPNAPTKPPTPTTPKPAPHNKPKSQPTKSVVVQPRPYIAPMLTVSNQSLYFANSGGTTKITIACNKDWGFTYLYKDAKHNSRSDDFSVKKEGDTLVISCTHNPYSYARTAQFNVFVREKKSIRYTVYLTQYAGISYYIYAHVDGNEFLDNGGTYKISVSTNSSDWYVESKSSWIEYRNKTNNSVEVYCKRNSTSSERFGYVTLRTTTGQKSKTIYFRQHKKIKASDEYFRYIGDYNVKWANIGIGIGYPFNFDISAFDFRFYWFDVSLLSFGVQTDYSGISNWYWQPNIGVLFPLYNLDAIRVSIGPKYNFRRHGYGDWDYYQTNRFELNKDWWFNMQFGYVWEWEECFSSEFFVRYNGCFAIGATINLHTNY